MLTKKEIYKKAYKELETRRLNRKIKEEENLKKAFKICAEIEVLYKQMNLTSIKIAKSLIYKKNNITKTIENIKNENLWIQKKIKELLIENNLPEDFLNIKPICEKCDDYGFVNNERCSCLEKLIKKITSEQLIEQSNLPKLTFENFNLNLYLENGEEISNFEHMTAVFNECRKFAEHFNKNCGGLLMHGLTGLGKTHLSLAIAFKIIEKGYTALYETSSQIIRNMLTTNFSLKENKDENSYISLITKTDLLILDDLGCEFSSQLNKSAIFEIINLRTSLNKPIIINTNYTPEELEKIYGERVISRIFSTLKIISFKGSDNRPKIGAQKIKKTFKYIN